MNKCKWCDDPISEGDECEFCQWARVAFYTRVARNFKHWEYEAERLDLLEYERTHNYQPGMGQP